MRQLMLLEPGKLQMRETAIPQAGPGEIVIKIKAALTCGTDLKNFRRGHPKFPMPMPMGHEYSGDVYQVGEGVSKFSVGQAVMLAPTAPCGQCRHCQRGYGNLCDYTMATMVHGGFAEYIKIPAHVTARNVFAKPDNLDYFTAASLEPLACVIYGDSFIRHTPQDTVVIIGAGPIGLMYIPATRLHGVKRIIVVGRRAHRLQAARDLGADVVIDEATCPNIEAAIKDLTDGQGADTVIECTGQPAVWEQSLRLACRGGQVMLFGGCASSTHFNLPMDRIVKDGLTVKGAFHFTPEAVAKTYNLLASGQIDTSFLITRKQPLSQYDDIFASLCRSEAIKIGIVPDK